MLYRRERGGSEIEQGKAGDGCIPQVVDAPGRGIAHGPGYLLFALALDVPKADNIPFLRLELSDNPVYLRDSLLRALYLPRYLRELKARRKSVVHRADACIGL